MPEYLTVSLDRKPWNTIEESVHSFMYTLTSLLGFTLGYLYCQKMPPNRRFLVEGLLVILPNVLNSTVNVKFNDWFCVVSIVLILYRVWRTRFWQELDNRTFDVGKRPVVFTLLRSNAYIGVCAAILAVDFPLFPHACRKSRYFGASVMDLGIGVFVWNMGLVSHRARNLRDLGRLPKVVAPLLVLGLGRTLIISLINYNQDEHEYGTHLNAFFMLGFTKLFGSLCTLAVRSDWQLLPLSLGILFLQELGLQMGLSNFVMSESAGRENLLTANREGLSALPGCIGLYIFSIYFAKWYTSKQTLSYVEMRRKLCQMLIMSISSWCLVFVSAHVLGIARVTFSAGYNIWVFATCASLLLIYMLLYELALKPSNQEAQQQLIGDAEAPTKTQQIQLPMFVEALNMNGLLHFMLSNLLTGFVNMTLKPDERNRFESVLIMTIYMLSSSCVSFVLYRRGIRIA
ncbi:uncharacterized protein At4g17910 [Scaptodrosophila lebanonensis]|uniref:Phosphatidylinositol-glycan biosynthesis class W protein n=1 Tax=Drosophila lebanonensis TaxID=7225 RepID=A0A6J2UB69_DROLE|nr:uncharacterized protein At4g17910 [Scaptodrosophila lebanonensis]